MSKVKNKELKEVTLLDLRQWYRRLGDNPSHELMDEFNEEVQSWNLYDLHYMLSSTSNHRWIRYYGVTLPHILELIENQFPKFCDFNHKERTIKDLTITPHNEKFRSVKLPSVKFQGTHDRCGDIQYFNLKEWRKLRDINHDLVK